MTDAKSPRERLLELVVFGPAGLAVTVVEEFPKLVDKGRHRVEGQVHTARLVGQFALQMGRRQVEQALERLGAEAGARVGGAAPPTSPPGHRVPRPAPPDAGPAGPSDATTTPAPDRGGAEVAAPGSRGSDVPGPGAGAADVPGPSGPLARTVPGGAAGNGRGPEHAPSLAIPGYDSLSASQVVQRLEGLSAPELEDVRAHEAAHRQRRTILHRIEQLMAGAPGSEP